MGDQSVSELNQASRQEHGARVTAALEQALSGKLTPPPAPAKGKPAAAAPKGSIAAGAAASAAPAAARVAPATAEVSAPVETEPGATGLEAPEIEASNPDPESAVEETAEVAPELSELQELGRKRDLRGIEKALGLEEGILGVNNASWKAYRKRVDEVAANETRLADGEATLVKNYGGAVNLVKLAQKGDLRAYAQLIQHTVGVSIDQFIGYYAKNATQLDPEVKTLREENARLRAGGNLVDTQGQPATMESATTTADTYITQEAGSHPAMKLSGAKEGIRKIWLGSFKKSSNSFGLTPPQAAQQFLKDRKAAYEREQWILAGKKVPPKPTTQALARRGASESQTRKTNLTREQLIEQGAEAMRRAKRAAGQR